MVNGLMLKGRIGGVTTPKTFKKSPTRQTKGKAGKRQSASILLNTGYIIKAL